MNESRPAANGSAPPEGWHRIGADEALRRLDVKADTGLAETEAAARQERLGRNVLEQAGPRTVARIVLGQFQDFMIWLLIVAAVIAGAVGEPEDAVAIVIIVVLNAIVGAVQEFRADRAIHALRKIAAPHARVKRGGVAGVIPASDLVPGDIVLMEAGDIVPADLRLVEAVAFRTQEAILTGESAPVEKAAETPGQPADTPALNSAALAFKGTHVVHGRGVGVVVATGMNTEIGRIAALLAGAEDTRTPLQIRLAAFGRVIAIVVLAICALIFGAGLLRGEPVVLMLLTAISLAVAAVPEALPAVVTVALALGARRMAKANALIRHLPAVETLGSVGIICTDKTGTLTCNEMRAARFAVLDSEHETPPDDPSAAVRLYWLGMALANDTEPDAAGAPSGDPTEVALVAAAAAAGVGRADHAARHPRTGEVPFDSARRRMATFHRWTDAPAAEGPTRIFVKGAPEQVLALCAHVHARDGLAPLDRARIGAQAEAWALDGYRVLALATRLVPGAARADDAECDLEFLGLIGLMDLPRPEAAAAVATCRAAGIHPVMITGDHPGTARAIAAKVGLAAADARVVIGADIERLSDDELAATLMHASVFARVAPDHKIRIVRVLQKDGHAVAMTGDGVNDAPALKQADVGVAMGRIGSEVAREAADLVLLDDNFATIVAAVREGRRMYDNVRKFIRFAMTGNTAEIAVLFAAPFLGLPLPLQPIHILWVNLITDGLPGLALAAEPAEEDVMERRPRPRRESILAFGVWQHILWMGFLLAAMCLGIQAWAIGTGSTAWQSMVFTALTLGQLAHVVAVRTGTAPAFGKGRGLTFEMIAALAVTGGLQMAALYVPIFNAYLNTQPLTPAELGICLGAAALVFLGVEAEKMCVRRGWLYKGAAAKADPAP